MVGQKDIEERECDATIEIFLYDGLPSRSYR